MNYLLHSIRRLTNSWVRESLSEQKTAFLRGACLYSPAWSPSGHPSEAAVATHAKTTEATESAKAAVRQAGDGVLRRALAVAQGQAGPSRAPAPPPARWPTRSCRATKVDASGGLVPDVRAAAAIIYDPDTNEILWEENAQTQRSIASITKVMTATVFLENNPDLTQPVTIARSDVFQASTTHLHAERQGDDRRPAALCC